MPRSRLERIRDYIRRRRYDMSAHAMEEMAEDLLDILDIEAAVLSGTINRMDKEDPRGTKYVVVGLLTTSEHLLAWLGGSLAAVDF